MAISKIQTAICPPYLMGPRSESGVTMARVGDQCFLDGMAEHLVKNAVALVSHVVVMIPSLPMLLLFFIQNSFPNGKNVIYTWTYMFCVLRTSTTGVHHTPASAPANSFSVSIVSADSPQVSLRDIRLHEGVRSSRAMDD